MPTHKCCSLRSQAFLHTRTICRQSRSLVEIADERMLVRTLLKSRLMMTRLMMMRLKMLRKAQKKHSAGATEFPRHKIRCAGWLLLALVMARVALAADTQVGRLREEGQQVYARYCVGCHGAQGDGKGAAADLLVVKPRDFRQGVFKFRSTPSGTLPTDEDLFRTITRGIYRTSMPEWSLLSERERLATVEYIKTFYPEWGKRGPGSAIHITDPPEAFGSPSSVARGEVLYDMLECWSCHGKSGRGDGPSANQLDPDAWGNPQRPFDFTSGRLKGGPTVKDIYRTFMTGIGGTAMPSYAEIFNEPDGENILEGDAWNLVAYIVSLQRTGPKSTVRMYEKEAAK